MRLNSAYIHLSINHAPILSSLIGSVVIAYGRKTKNESVEKTGLALLAFSGLAAIPTVITGLLSKKIVEPIPSVSKHAIAVHQRWAIASSALSFLQGGIAAGALKKAGGSSAGKNAFLLSLVTDAAMGIAAHYAAEIRHSETRSDDGYEREKRTPLR